MKLLEGLPFVSMSDRAYLPTSAGVYIVTTADQVLYVGQSATLRQRLRGHGRLGDFHAGMATRIYYLLLPVALLDPIEAALIAAMAPLLNISTPKVRSTEAAPSSVHNPWGEPKDSLLPPQRMTPKGLELLKRKAKLSGLSLPNFLECIARGIEPSPESIRAYVDGRKQTVQA